MRLRARPLSASVWRWHRDGTEWTVDEVITIPVEPADAADLPPALQPFGAVPPLVTDIDLSVDDQMLYVSCWGTGELKQYDVSDRAAPREVGSVHLGGVVRRAAHPAAPSEPLAGGPQMVEVSRDGKRIFVTNSLYGAWATSSTQPESVPGWRRSTPTPPREGSPSTSASSHGGSSSTVVACTRCACRAATPRRTLTATADAGKRTGDPRLGLSPPDMTGRGSSTKQKPWIARDVDVYALSPWCWRGWSAGLAVLGHGEQYGGCF